MPVAKPIGKLARVVLSFKIGLHKMLLPEF